VRVVVIGEDVERVLEMATIEDEEPVEAFAADGADETFGGLAQASSRSG